MLFRSAILLPRAAVPAVVAIEVDVAKAGTAARGSRIAREFPKIASAVEQRTEKAMLGAVARPPVAINATVVRGGCHYIGKVLGRTGSN